MSIRYSIVFLVMIVLSFSVARAIGQTTAPTSQPTPAPMVALPPGMTPLFDGRTLAGWKQIPAD